MNKHMKLTFFFMKSKISSKVIFVSTLFFMINIIDVFFPIIDTCGITISKEEPICFQQDVVV